MEEVSVNRILAAIQEAAPNVSNEDLMEEIKKMKKQVGILMGMMMKMRKQ